MFADTSYKSEPVSDFNEDSRDSIIRSRSCTPIKPSPLTIKAEQTDEEDNDSNTDQKVQSGKLTMRLKVPKIESDSPRKRLKDKFEKEKGQQIKNKKKCKIKGEQDSEEDENSADEGDEDNKGSGDHKTNKNAKSPEGHSEKDDEKEDSKYQEAVDKKEESNYDEVDGLGDVGKDAEVVQIKKEVKLTDLKETTSETDKNSTDADINVTEESSEIHNEGTKTDVSRALTKEDNNLNCNNKIHSDNSEKKDFKEFKDDTKGNENASVEESVKTDIKSDRKGAQSSGLDNCHLNMHNDKDNAKDTSNNDKTISDNENNLCIQGDDIVNKSGNEIVKSVDVSDNQTGFSADKDKTKDSNLSSETSDEKLEFPDAKGDEVKITEETSHSENSQVCDSNVDTESEEKSAIDIPSDKTEINSIEKSENVCKSKLEEETLKSEMPQQSVLDSKLSQEDTVTDRKNIDKEEKEVRSKTLEPVVATKVRLQTPEAVVCKLASSESQNIESPVSSDVTDSNSKLDSNIKITEDTQEVVQVGDNTSYSSVKYDESESKKLVFSKAEEHSEDSVAETKESSPRDDGNKVEIDKHDVREENQNDETVLTKSDSESVKRECSEIEDKKTSDSHDESDKKEDDILRDQEVKTCDKIRDNISNDQTGDSEQNNKSIESKAKHEQTDSSKLGTQKEDSNAEFNDEVTSSKEDSVKDTEKTSNTCQEGKIVNGKEETTHLATEKQNKEVSEKHSEISESTETKQTASPQRKTKVAVRKLTKKADEKVSETQEKTDKNEKDDSSDKESSSDSSEDDSSSSDSSEDVPLTRMKGLLAHSRLNKGKAVKRQVCLILSLILKFSYSRNLSQINWFKYIFEHKVHI